MLLMGVAAIAEVLIRLVVEALPEGGFVATSDDVPGLVAQGRTLAETVEIAQDVARRIAESMTEHGDPLPPALSAPVTGRTTVVAPVTVGP